MHIMYKAWQSIVIHPYYEELNMPVHINRVMGRHLYHDVMIDEPYILPKAWNFGTSLCCIEA